MRTAVRVCAASTTYCKVGVVKTGKKRLRAAARIQYALKASGQAAFS
jgi:hypothetical protein